MKTTHPITRSELDEQVARRCESHLALEETLLIATTQSLREVRAALLRGDWRSLPELLTFQNRLVEDESNLAVARTRLQEEMANLLGLEPECVTMRKVADSLPESLAASLLRTRERMLKMAREAQALRQANAALIGYSLDFSRKLFERLAGPEAPERYGPGGKRRRGASNCLIQGRG